MPSLSRALGKLELHSRKSFFARQVLLPIRRFIRVEEIAGGPLIVAAVIAVVWANSPWSDSYFHLWEKKLGFTLDGASLKESLKHWVNDALLPLFFFVAGMEIKRELVEGELSSRARAAMPVATALGGMLIPALIYLGFNVAGGHPKGWGVPIATDIAFVLAVLALAGSRVPRSLKTMVLAFAVVDDIGGVLVIAFFYSSEIHWWALGAAAGILAVIGGFKFAGVRKVFPYVVTGGLFWGAMFASGVHTTIAGVILGFMVQSRPTFSREDFAEEAGRLIREFEDVKTRRDAAERSAGQDPARVTEARRLMEREDALLGALDELTAATEAPVDRLIRKINPSVSYMVLPLFALANAGVEVGGDMLSKAATSPAALGVLVGLTLGKPVGFLGFAWLASRLGIADKPEDIPWGQMGAAGVASGIGFTVSLFIAEEGFGGEETLTGVKLAVLAASVIAGLIGFALLLVTAPKPGEGVAR